MTSLKTEHDNDPLGRGYSGMTDQEFVDSMNGLDRSRNRESMTGDEVAQAAVPADYDALDDGSANNTTDAKSHWLAFCGRAEIDPFGTANEALVKSIFGFPSDTVTALLASRVEAISRAEELPGVRSPVTLKMLKLESVR